MNTSKQINIMVALVFISVLAAGAYTIWDPQRADDAKARQLEKTIDRGAFLFSQNCIACHGDAGEGGVASNRLKLAPPLNRPDLQGKDSKTGQVDPVAQTNVYKRVYYTITCGRIGKAMPTWGQSQGGPLNDEQIKQLATMITQGTGWELSREYAIHGAPEFDVHGYGSDLIFLARDLDETATTVYLNDVLTVSNGIRLQIDEELMLVNGVQKAGLTVERGSDGTAAAAHNEKVIISGAGNGATLSKAIDDQSTQLTVSSLEQFETGDKIKIGDEVMTVTAVANEASATVERGLGTTRPAAHTDGTHVLKPPVPPDPPAITGEGSTPACGQVLPAEVPTPGPAVPSTQLTITARGLLFNTDTLTGVAEQQLAVTFDNQDTDQHNIHFYDGEDETAPSLGATDIEPGPVVQTLTLAPLPAGQYYYRCEVHPTTMTGFLTTVAVGAGSAPVAGAATAAAAAPSPAATP